MLVKYEENCGLSVSEIKMALQFFRDEAAKYSDLYKLQILLDSIMVLLCRYETISMETLLNLDLLDDGASNELKNNLEYLHKIVANQNVIIKK